MQWPVYISKAPDPKPGRNPAQRLVDRAPADGPISCRMENPKSQPARTERVVEFISGRVRAAKPNDPAEVHSTEGFRCGKSAGLLGQHKALTSPIDNLFGIELPS